ncbi:cytochrome c [Myxococcota bacterium]|nr:cytochrome c [Myxococcota bacterium]
MRRFSADSRPLLVALALLVGVALPGAARAADLAAGQKVYMANCMACHGISADGKGPAAASLQPPPADFTSPSFWASRDTAKVKSVIKTGKPGTPMMPFTQLSDQDLENLVAFLESKKP